MENEKEPLRLIKNAEFWKYENRGGKKAGTS